MYFGHMTFAGFSGPPSVFVAVPGESPALTALRRQLFDVEALIAKVRDGWATQAEAANLSTYVRQREGLLVSIAIQIEADAAEVAAAFASGTPSKTQKKFRSSGWTRTTATPVVLGMGTGLTPATNANTPSTGGTAAPVTVPLVTTTEPTAQRSAAQREEEAKKQAEREAWAKKQAEIAEMQARAAQAEADAAAKADAEAAAAAKAEQERLALIAAQHDQANPEPGGGIGWILAALAAKFIFF